MQTTWNKTEPFGFLSEREQRHAALFFHLSFGDRILPDDEGVELPNRSAAREEALAAVRDLSDPAVGGNPRRWASWFLQVTDEQGQFFRTPIGHPALEIVAPNGREGGDEELRSKAIQPTTIVPAQNGAASRARPADLLRELWGRLQRTAQLLEHNRALRDELSSLYLMSEILRVRSRRLVAQARLAACH